jgi:ketosteroid isomerase-like protein
MSGPQWGPDRRVMSITVEELAGQYHEAWTKLDVDDIVALHTEDSVFHLHGVIEAATGHVAIRQTIGALLRLVPDLHFEAKRAYLGADHIVLEYDMSGTVGETHFVCDGADVIAVESGLVARKDTYLDLAAYQAQVGPLPTLAIGV